MRFLGKTFLIVIGLLGIFIIWQVYAPPVFTSGKAVQVTIAAGEGSGKIASQLKQKGVIGSALLFNTYAAITGERGKLQPGVYDFSQSVSLAQVADKIAAGDSVKAKVTIIDGWTIQDIAGYLDKQGVYSKKDFLAAVSQDYSDQFDFLKDKPKTASLEGYLFPDTYYVPANYRASDFVKMMLANFGHKVTPQMRQEIAARNLTVYQAVTMASLIEKEAANPDDQKMVAGILYKRLAAGVPLQVDSTINYIKGTSTTKITLTDMRINSPYNTYLYSGLPKGPISSPGMSSLLAAVYPASSSYWYYLSTSSGQIVFSKTLQQHELAIEKYLTR